LSNNLHLLRELVKRDFHARFAGSALGVTWAVFQPLSLVALYWFVFTFMIPGGRLGLGEGDDYIYFLIAGLLPWLAISEGLMRSTTAIVESASIIRRLPVRVELLILVPNITAIIFECIGLAIFAIALVAQGMSLRQLWILPAALAAQLVIQAGLGLILAVTYVFFRDLTQIVGFVLAILFYLSPILYPVRDRFATFFFWNPMTALLGLFRSAMLSSPLPDASSIVFLWIAATGLLAAGLLFLRRTRAMLVDLV
jgi:lipopolysaccharide transport system permease protein